MQELDEKGFVFLDGRSRPYLCAMWGGNPWLFYWHPDNHWVSSRRVTQCDIFGFPRNLSQEEQDLYHSTHKKYNKAISADPVQGADEIDSQ